MTTCPPDAPRVRKDITERCVACGSTGIMPSPLDIAKGCRVRSWTPKSVGGDRCELCFEVQGLMRTLPPARRVTTGTDEWQVLLQAYASLKLEGVRIIDQPTLLARYQILMSVQFLAGGASKSMSSSASSAAGTTRSDPSDAGGTSGKRPEVTSDVTYITPKKKQKMSGASSGTLTKGLSSETLPSPNTSMATPGGALGSLTEERVRAEQPSAGASAQVGDDEFEPVILLSIEGAMTKTRISQSMLKFRSTVNGYCGHMTELTWFEQLKPPTLKALQRRLIAYDSDIKNGLDIEMIRVYNCLCQRLSGMLAAYKALQQWVSTQDDSHLRRFVELIRPINMFFEFVSAGSDLPMKLAADLRVLSMQARFSRVWHTTKSVTTALNEVDQADLFQCFVEISASAVAASSEVKHEPKDKSDEGGKVGEDAADDHGARSVGIPSEALPKSKLVTATSAKDWLAMVLDMTLQMKFHELSDAEGQLASQADEVCSDLSGVGQNWSKRFGDDDVVQGMEFGTLLNALTTVFEVSGSNKGAATPSLVRDARQMIFKCSSTTTMSKPFRMAAAMSHYKVCGEVMERAKEVASAGMQDQAADREFLQAVSKLHDSFTGAMENLGNWATAGNAGGWQDIRSMTAHLQTVREVMVQVRSTNDLWSLAGVEEQTDSLHDCFTFASVVFDTTPIVAAKVFYDTVSVAYPGGKLLCADELGDTGDIDEILQAEVPVSGAAASAVEIPRDEDGQAPVRRRGVPPEGPVLPDLSRLGPAAARLTDELGTMMAKCVECIEVTTSLYRILVDKLGPVFAQSVSDVDADPQVCMTRANVNKVLFDSMMLYLNDIAWLAAHDPLDLQRASMTTNPEHATHLVSFCDGHRRLGEETSLEVETTDDLATILSKTNFSKFATAFKDTIGNAIFNVHAGPTTASALTALEQMELTIVPVDSACVDAISAVDSIFSRVIEAPSVQVLSEWLKDTTADENLHKYMEKWKHNSLLTNLTELVTSIGCENLPSVRIRKLDSQDDLRDGPPTNIVLQSLTMSCTLHDIAYLAAALHAQLFLKDPKAAKGPTMATLTSSIPHLMANLARSLDKLEEVHASEAMKALEVDGWRMPTTASTASMWHGGMLAYKDRIVRHVLRLWADGLTVAAQRAQASTPAWSACVQNGEWDHKLASSMLLGKSKVVVAAHNDLFETITVLNGAATTANILPRLQTNPITAEAVAIALHALAAVKDAAAVCDGMQLLSTYHESHLGPAKASAFLAKFGPAQHPNIPAIFWQPLQAMAADAGAKASVASAGGSSAAVRADAERPVATLPAVKQEAPDLEVAEVPRAASAPTPAVKTEGAKRMLKGKRPS